MLELHIPFRLLQQLPGTCRVGLQPAAKHAQPALFSMSVLLTTNHSQPAKNDAAGVMHVLLDSWLLHSHCCVEAQVFVHSQRCKRQVGAVNVAEYHALQGTSRHTG
jgi:hypothetical protein